MTSQRRSKNADLFADKASADRAYDAYVGRCVSRGTEPMYIVEWLFTEPSEADKNGLIVGMMHEKETEEVK